MYPAPVPDTFTGAFDAASSERVTGTAATVALVSDVLFAVDEAVLTPSAEQVVAAAGVEIASVAAGGEVVVVGHTDDVSSDAYNQDLSVRRVQAVTAVLAPALGGRFTGLAADRGLKMTAMVAGLQNVTLLGQSSRFYPVDYVIKASETGQDSRQILADTFVVARLEQGDTITVTIAWPDVGGSAVTIDVPDRFRLVDVPVTA